MRPFLNRARARCLAPQAFTMVEIAIALGVIAIALVAIIGVMPIGVNVQRTNRDDTVLNQDGRLWLEAIRTGARGLHYLTNHVEAIWITNSSRTIRQVTLHTNSPIATRSGNPAVDGSMITGARIIGLLSRPKILLTNPPPERVTNYIAAYVHAISGSAADQNAFVRENRMDFMYRLTSEIVPFTPFPPILTNFTDPVLVPGSFEWVIRSNNWLVARNHATNAYEVCLTLQGPVIHRGPGFGYQVLGTPRTFRTLISAGQSVDRDLFFFEPATYLQVRP